MKRERVIDSTVVLLLTVIALATLAPLFLMLHTSFKPTGTLTKRVEEVTVISKKEIRSAAVIKLRQDMRKFSSIVFFIRTDKLPAQFEVTLSDIQDRKTSVNSRLYHAHPAGGGLQKITIPLSAFTIKKLNFGLPEKVAEDLTIRLDDQQGAAVFIESISLPVKRFTLMNYRDMLISGYFARYLFNSLLIAVVITLGNLFFCTLVGYAFARKTFPFKNALFIFILASVAIPPQILIVPIFIMMKNIGWLNTYWALIVPSLAQPFGIFLMKQYISRLPTSLEDQARVDGATEKQILFNIIFPLSRPALAIVGINTFMGAWNTFLFPFLLTNTPEMRTLPVGLALFKNLQGAGWTQLMAASSITALPVIIVFLAFQKHIIAGLTTGLVKR
jgi:multiple sugar transport system permease protein